MAVKLKVHEDSTRLTVHGGGTVTFTAEQGFPVYPEMQTKSVQYTPSESAITDTVAPDSGYGGLTEVGVAVDAIPPNYVGSNVPRRSGSDLAEEGGTVTAPSGYYSQEASKAVPELDRERCIVDFGRYYVTDDGERFWKIYGYFQETDGIGGYVEPYTRIDGDVMWFNAISIGTTVTPREARQTIGGANVMMEGGVTVEAIPSNYVGSGITRRSRDDLSGDYDEGSFWVGGPAGYYANNFSYAVPSGTAGTPSAVVTIDTSGAEAVITPTVTNSGGYIEGGTKNGSNITVTAGELVAGNTMYCDDSGDWNVSEAETFVVPAGTAGTPTATKGAVSNHSVSVTPSVTNTTGYITGSTKTGTAVTVSASELVSGNLPITQNGNNIDCANYSTVSVNVASGSSKNAQVVQSTTRTNASTLTAIGAELTVSKTGTYDIYYSCFRTNTSASYTWATRLYINGTAYGTAENATWTNNQQNTHLSNISLTAGDKLRVYGRETRGTSYYVCAPTLVIVEA